MSRSDTSVDTSIVAMARERGYVRPRDLALIGVSRPQLGRLVERGLLERVGHGLYRAPDAQATEQHTLALVAARAPGGVACLLTALRFHDLTTQAPFEIWLAIGRKAARPQLADLPVRVVYFSGAAFTACAIVAALDTLEDRKVPGDEALADTRRVWGPPTRN